MRQKTVHEDIHGTEGPLLKMCVPVAPDCKMSWHYAADQRGQQDQTNIAVN
jgi:hypothetical protein